MPAGHDAYGALRYRDYRLLLSGGVLATLGMEMQATVVGWELYQRMGDPLVLGLAGLMQFLPVLLLALPAGQAVDLFPRKLLYMAALVIWAAASLGLRALSHYEGPVGGYYLCLLLIGVGRAFIVPARMALLSQVVPREELGNAVTWNSTGWQMANVAGPALGGLLLAVSYPEDAYGLTAALAGACLTLVAAIRPRATDLPRERPTLATLLAGIRFVWRTKMLLGAITLDLFAVLFGGATALLPIFAQDILQIGETEFGWLRASPALGALAMGVVLAYKPPFNRAGLALLLAVAGFGAATIGFGLSRDFALSFVFLALTGAFDSISVVIRHTLMQVLTPDSMRGRVAAVNFVFISSSNELGAFESGVAAWLFSPVIAVVGGGAVTILVVAAVMLRWPQLSRLRHLHRAHEVVSEERPTDPMPG